MGSVKKIARWTLTIVLACVGVLLIYIAFNAVGTEPLMQDFHIGLKVGNYGSVSGTLKATAIDFYSSGTDNNAVLLLSPEDDTFRKLEVSSGSENFTFSVSDRDQYSVQPLTGNASFTKLNCDPDCEVSQVTLNNGVTNLKTSGSISEYDVALKMVENSIIPRFEVRYGGDRQGSINPHMKVQLGESGVSLTLYGKDLDMTIAGVNYSFTDITTVRFSYFEEADLDWITSGSFQYYLYPGTEASIYGPTDVRLDNLTGHVESFGGALLLDDSVKGEKFRGMRIWAEELDLYLNEWVFIDLFSGELTVETDNDEYSLNIMERTRPSPIFQNEEAQSIVLSVAGGLVILLGVMWNLTQDSNNDRDGRDSLKEESENE